MSAGLSFTGSRSFAPQASVNPNNAISRFGPPAQKPEPVVDLPALQNASRVLQEQFVKDAQIVPDLGDMLTIRAFNLWSILK